MLVTQNRQFIKHFALRIAKRTLGNGLLTSEGDFWRRQRKLAQPAFHRERIAGLRRRRWSTSPSGCSRRWADGQARDVQDDMMRLTLEIVAKTPLRRRRLGATRPTPARAMETLDALLHRPRRHG